MTEQFKPGDLVECVDADPASGLTPSGNRALAWHPGEELVEGAVYTIRGGGPAVDWCPSPTVYLREIVRRKTASWGHREIAYGAWRFRLYRSPSIDALIRQCSDPADSEDTRDGATPIIRERA